MRPMAHETAGDSRSAARSARIRGQELFVFWCGVASPFLAGVSGLPAFGLWDLDRARASTGPGEGWRRVARASGAVLGLAGVVIGGLWIRSIGQYCGSPGNLWFVPFWLSGQVGLAIEAVRIGRTSKVIVWRWERIEAPRWRSRGH